MAQDRLVIISHTPHYRRDGQIVGWGATLREIDHLAGLFGEVVHVAPLYDTPAPPSAIPYAAANVRLEAVPPAGGETLADKIAILWRLPGYALTIWRAYGAADVIHVRCPANISLIAVLLLALRRQPRTRWLKYAGNWKPSPGDDDPLSYRLQRWLLRRHVGGGVVTVNGEWPDHPAHVRSFFNPGLTAEELRAGAGAATEKRLTGTVKLVYVGRLERWKGTNYALEVIAALKQRGVPVHFDLVGDGPERPDYEQQAAALGITDCVTFHGWVPRAALEPFYADAHLMLFPSLTEGWPKVLSEAMAYGVVPVASAVSSIPQFLGRFGAGQTRRPDDVAGFADAIAHYAAHPDAWRAESARCVEVAPFFSYDHYLTAVSEALDRPS